MRCLLAILLAWPLTLFAADGDITGAAVEDNGWILDVWIAGNSSSYTNGTFNTQLVWFTNVVSGVTNYYQSPGTSTTTLTLTSAGYNDDGTTNQTVRTIYGTKQVRFAYPNQAYSDSTIDGSNIKIKLAMSEYVYAGDISVTVNLPAGLYATNTLTSAAAASQPVTNNSVQPYPKAIANWSYPGNQLVNSSTMRLRAVGFNWSAQQGRPLRGMKFIVTGASSGVAISNVVTKMTLDRTLPDTVPFAEYIYDADISGMTQGELLRCDFIAYPWIGDSGALIDTTLNTYTWPTAYPIAYTNRCNRTGAFVGSIAVVDAGGSDVNGRASQLTDPTAVDSAIYFATIGKAATCIAATNNTYNSHNDLEASTIYVRSGINTFTGSATTPGNAPNTWLTITAYPGDAVDLNTQGSARSLGAATLHRFLSISNSAGYLWYDTHVWFDRCTFNTAAATTFNLLRSLHITDCTVQQIPGIGPATTARGNNLDGLSNSIYSCAVVVGNSHPTTNGPTFRVSTDGPTTMVDGCIIYNNDFRGSYGNVNELSAGLNYAHTNGVAILQNVFEFGSSDAGAQIAAFGNNAKYYTNVLVWNNVFVGVKANFFYNDAGTAVAYRNCVNAQGNVWDDFNIKGDVYVTGNANRVGNWPQTFGVGFGYNVVAETSGITGAGSFVQEYIGLHALGISSPPNVGVATNTTQYLRFIDREAYATGFSNPSPGGGNYRTHSDAPQLIIGSPWILPHDLEGQYRGLSDPAGAYASANPRKGAGFFSP